MVTITECVNCGVDFDVHDMDGCDAPDYERVRVHRCCYSVECVC